jgi:hypothetical protein
MDRGAEPPGIAGQKPTGASWRRQLALRACALSLGVGLGLLGMEGLARLLLTDFYACDPAVGWTFAPGRSGLKLDRRLEYAVHARINSAGLHDVEHAPAKPPGTLRVVLLGDSMLAGMQVPLEQSFARRLEVRLEQDRPGAEHFEVVNCAMDGFGTAQALLLYEAHCRRYQPDLVLLGFFATNDVLDNYWGARSLNHPVARKCGRPYFELQGGRLARVGASLPAVADPATPLLDRVLRRSYLYQVIAPPPGQDEERPRFRLHDVFLTEYTAEHEAAWAVTKQLLLAFDEAVRRDGARFGVLAIPSAAEIYPERAHDPGAGRRLDLGRPLRILAAFLAEHGIGYLDLAPGLREAAARAHGAPLYFQRDMHWTGPGNGLVGELVARWVGARYSRASGPPPAPLPRPGSLSALPESSSTTGPPLGPRC